MNVDQLQYPRSVALDRAAGRVMVADQCNNRIVVAEQDLTGTSDRHLTKLEMELPSIKVGPAALA